MRKISEVLRLRYELKRSYRDIASSLNISISTVSDYLRRAKAAKIDGWPMALELSEEALYKKLFLPAKEARRKKPHPDWELINKELRRPGVTLLLLWREYKEVNPEGLCYTQFCEHYRSFAKKLTPSMRQAHKAGEKTFVDYAGMTMPWLDVSTGEICEAQIFVGTLGASGYTFVEATPSQQVADWVSSHINMWAYFGGVSKVVVPDNLKAGVTKSHRYDPDINPNYQHLGEHYGFAIVPARAYKPKDKAKVENAVGCIERQILAPLRNLTFTSIGQINAEIKKRLAGFNAKQFQKMETSRQALFDSIDKPALKPLPQYQYQFASWKKAKVAIDYHVVYDNHYYSVPYQYIKEDVEIRATAKVIECFYKEKRIAAHTRSYARYRHTTLKEHMPSSHQKQGEWTPERIMRWANTIGSQTKLFIEQMISARRYPEQAFRSCLGLLRLAARYGEDRLEKACTIGIKEGAYRYQHIENVLKNKLDQVNQDVVNKTPVINGHVNIRGANYYQ